MRRTMQCEMPDPMSAPGTHRPFAVLHKFVRFRGECVAELVTSSFFGASSVGKRPVCVGSPMGEPRPQRPGTNARRHLTPTPHTSRPLAGLDI